MIFKFMFSFLTCNCISSPPNLLLFVQLWAPLPFLFHTVEFHQQHTWVILVSLLAFWSILHVVIFPVWTLFKIICLISFNCGVISLFVCLFTFFFLFLTVLSETRDSAACVEVKSSTNECCILYSLWGMSPPAAWEHKAWQTIRDIVSEKETGNDSHFTSDKCDWISHKHLRGAWMDGIAFESKDTCPISTM